MRYIALAISLLLIAGSGFSQSTSDLTRSTPAAEKVNAAGITAYAKAVKESGLQLHSYMVLRHGKVIAADWLGDHSATEEHVMHSVSKTFTSTAIGFAVTEGLLKISDKVISFFPNDLPDTVTPYLREMTVWDLLIMSCGHGKDPSDQIRKHEGSWVKQFLAYPIVNLIASNMALRNAIYYPLPSRKRFD